MVDDRCSTKLKMDKIRSTSSHGATEYEFIHLRLWIPNRSSHHSLTCIPHRWASLPLAAVDPSSQLRILCISRKTYPLIYSCFL